MEGNSSSFPTVSVVMPSHNRRERLGRALRQVSRLEYPVERLEVVVVLDGCTDGSEEMIQGLKETYPFSLKVVSRKQGGPGAARNAGVLAASHEYILFLDDDVMATPRLLKEHLALHQQDQQAVVVGPMTTPTDHQRPVWVRWEEYILESQYKLILNGTYGVGARQFYTGNCSLRRDLIIEAGLFDESYKRYEDVELGYRMEQRGARFYFSPKAIGYHYANRSLDSWLRMHYLYGIYAVKLDRDKGLAGMISASQREFKERHFLTQLVARRLLDHKRLQKALAWVFVAVARVASRVGQERRSYEALSCVANVFFWQGFNEELRATQVAPVETALPLQV